MRKALIPLLLVSLGIAGCETTDGGSGYLTHSDHRLSASERAAVGTAMENYLRVPVTVSGLKASYDLNAGTVAVCGHVAGRGTAPVPFAGTLSAPGSRHFVPLRTPGKGKDQQRIATVRAFCQAAHINF